MERKNGELYHKMEKVTLMMMPSSTNWISILASPITVPKTPITFILSDVDGGIGIVSPNALFYASYCGRAMTDLQFDAVSILITSNVIVF